MPPMKAAIDSFKKSIERVRHLGGLHNALSTLITTAVDSSDLLRAQLVLAVSALDYFIHELTILGMIEVLEGQRAPTESFRRYKVSSGLLITPGGVSSAAFEEDIRDRHSYLSFQQPDKIADAIRLFWENPLWRGVAVRIGKTEDVVKTELRLIIDRRNKIAHEADLDPSYPDARWPINPPDCIGAINFIESICNAIYAEVT